MIHFFVHRARECSDMNLSFMFDVVCIALVATLLIAIVVVLIMPWLAAAYDRIIPRYERWVERVTSPKK